MNDPDFNPTEPPAWLAELEAQPDPPALEPLLVAYDADVDLGRRRELAHALALLGIADERIFSRLVALHGVDPLAAAPGLARYPDRRGAWNLEVGALDEASYKDGLPDLLEGGARSTR